MIQIEELAADATPTVAVGYLRGVIINNREFVTCGMDLFISDKPGAGKVPPSELFMQVEGVCDE